MPKAEIAAASVGDALAAARGRLAAAGAGTPALDAELLLGAVLAIDRAGLVMERDRSLAVSEAARFDSLLARREAREPVAYILGRRDFRRLTLSVDRRVLIPRPETELLVEIGLGLAPGASVVDVGTGSGAVALALKDERPDLTVRATDVSAGALAVARENARRLGIDVTFAQADLLDTDVDGGGSGDGCDGGGDRGGGSGGSGGGGRGGDRGPWDAVLANLPYVATGAPLPPEITRFEPPRALFAGADGLDLVRRLVAALRGPSVDLVALEIGPEQAAAVQRLVRAAGFTHVEILADLAGLDRVVVGRT